ncbi:MAG: hypothetical protein LC130_05500 [Bryobacterales bacterium]|nr:hypothetical protein [Bryobacterales bacterium]
MYHPHPCVELDTLFRGRPFQGAVPEQARFIFIGLDANFDASIETTPGFQHVIEYLADGVAFWQRYGVHHPFLLPGYRGDGCRYHRNFARIGFTPGDAPSVSFIELLDVPTVGRSRLEPRDLDERHLGRIDALVTGGESRDVFVSAGVVRLMLASRAFSWLKPKARPDGVLPLLYACGGTRVHLHLHFSNYGKFQAQLEREAIEIARLIQCGPRRSPC